MGGGGGKKGLRPEGIGKRGEGSVRKNCSQRDGVGID